MHIKHSIYFFILVLVVTILYSATSLAKDNVAFVNVKDYGAVGDGTTNDTAAIQAAVDALPVGGSIIFPAGIYAINDMIILSRKKSVSIEGNQATLLQTTGHKRSLWIDKSDHVVVKNLRVERNEYTDYTGAFSDSKGIYITESHHVSVLYSAFIGFGYSGVSWYLSDYIHIEGNHIVGPGSSIPSQGNYCYGVNSYSTPSSYGHIKILNNTISDVAIGIFVGEQEDVVISGNEITDIPGQHGMYLATSNSVISNNTLKNIELDGIKVQIGQKATKDINNVIITSNSIKNVGNTGIDLNQYESSLYYFTNAQISNNSVYQGSYGIVAKGQKNMKISNNALYDLDSYGIFSSFSYGDINDNIIHNTRYTGIYLRALNEGTSNIHNNTLINPALDSQDETYQMVGMYISEGLKVFVSHNIIFFDGSFNPDMSYSLYATSSSRVSLLGNDFPQDQPVYLGGYVDRLQDNMLGETTIAQNTDLISGKGPTHDYYGPSADSSGSRTFYQGDRIWNSRPEPGAPVGWVCVGSSSPCSWKSFGTVNDD